MKLLIVEDEKKLAEATAKGLMMKGFAVDIIGDGAKALNRISVHRDQYDLIILDLMLPSMDGHQVCRSARELGVTTPILILTARAETDNKVNLLMSGADDYLVKPFSFDELVARIHALLRRPTTVVRDVLRVQDIELNPAERTVRRGEEQLQLTLKEFSLLEYFMQRPNQVVNREELLGNLWDFNYASFSNVVDVHIKNLRQKLDRTGAPGILETIRGIGYRLRQ